jgi:hypothetical protein
LIFLRARPVASIPINSILRCQLQFSLLCLTVSVLESWGASSWVTLVISHCDSYKRCKRFAHYTSL